MKVKSIAILIISLLFTETLSAQEIPIPADIKLENVADFAKYHKEILSCIDWLENNALDHPARQKVNSFVMLWLEGSPNVSVEIDQYIIEYTKKNPEFLMTFMGGWTTYCLNNPTDKNPAAKGNLAGIKSILKVYKLGQGVKKDKNIEKLLEMDEEELTEWLSEQVD
ncbi:MAG: hypothetical protein JKY42_07110 [Flavobacteriales bacterium]|nr:hypothetical protein [Flavobacteriales bacterium]